MTDYKNILQNFIEFNKALSQLKEDIKTIPFDIDNVIEINKFCIVKIFNKYKNKEFSTLDFEEWAKVVAYRTGINYETQFEYEIIHQIANPRLYMSLEKSKEQYYETLYSKISKHY
jgi:hypothetical protein